MDREKALYAITINAAKNCGIADRVGSLEPGKVADMVLLSQNPYEVAPADLGKTSVEGIFLGGVPYERQSQGIAKAVFSGLLSKARF